MNYKVIDCYCYVVDIIKVVFDNFDWECCVICCLGKYYEIFVVFDL